jgi:hypothetical protein
MSFDFIFTIAGTVYTWFSIILETMKSPSAGNLGSILSGIGTISLAALALAWTWQKRMEKKSDIAEYALDNLYVFSEEIRGWLEFANSWIVYSRHSEENVKKLNSLPENEKKEFIAVLNSDPCEASNYYKRGIEIVKILKTITYRSKRLFDEVIDEKLNELNKRAQKLPNKLMAMHFNPNPEEIKITAKEYLQDSFEIIEKDCSDIHDLLLNYLMFKRKKFSWFRMQFHRLKKICSNLRCKTTQRVIP